jgi:hypothetical protein
MSPDPAEVTVSGSPVEVDLLAQLDDGRPLPRRERVTTPLTYVLLGAFSLVLAFGAGAWTQKHHGSSSSTATTGAANSAAAAFGAGATGTGAGRAGGFGAGGASAAAAGGTGAAGTGATGAAGTTAIGGATVGQVKLVDGSNVYVTDQQGITVKVTLAAGGTVQVSKDGAVSDLKAGDTVIVQGEAGTDGTVAATSIRTGGVGGLGTGTRGGAGAGATATTTTVK